MASNPNPAASGLLSAVAGVLFSEDDVETWAQLLALPTAAVQIGTTAQSKQLFTGACILDGWLLRETTGAGPALVEFIDGPDANGPVVGEASILAPLTGAGGFTDVDVDSSAANAAAANNVTLPAAAGQTTFITGFEITGAGATAGSVIPITVTGVLGGTKTYQLAIPAGAGVGIVPLIVEYSRPIPGAGVNTAIVVNVPSFGAGNTNAAATVHGFQRLVAAAGAGLGQVGTGPGGLNYLFCRAGIFMRVIAGSVTGAVWIKG